MSGELFFWLFLFVVIPLGILYATGHVKKFFAAGYLQKCLKWFWSYKEMRFLVTACVIIWFASICFGQQVSKIEELKIEVKHTHILEGGKSYSPVVVELKNR